MVTVNRGNIRRVYSPSERNTFLGKVNIFLDNHVPFLAHLSPIDRLILLCGSTLLGVVAFSYFFLIFGITSSDVASSSNMNNDPRLSEKLRKIGLSKEALLRRGGGKRISVGKTHQQLDSEENAVALDIISTLNCDALQEELERDWKTVLDSLVLNGASDVSYSGNSGETLKFNEGHVDDFAAELAKEVKFQQDTDSHKKETWSGNVDAGNERVDDHMNRRLNDVPDFRLDDPMGMGGAGMVHVDDFTGNSFGNYGTNYDDYGLKLTAQHLFCLAADSLTLPKYKPSSKESKESVKDPTIHCDVESFEVRESLLYLWSSAKSQMPEDVLVKSLRLVTEHKETLRGNEVHLWYPPQDKGAEGMLKVLNSAYNGQATYNFDTEPADVSHDDLYRFHDLPKKYVGSNKLFVDVGSALGFTSMLVSYLYPETVVVAIEPAAPSWLIQNLNYRCNLSHEQRQFIHPILAGVGTKHHDDNDYMMKMIWRPSMTTSTRSWNEEKAFDFATDMELTVHLRTLKTILAEATPDDLPLGTPISVLNLDCEGCEYNLIPSMHETTFNSVGLILGRTNWGFIPKIKKPSSERGTSTHKRLCTQYNFAKRCKECCDFPSLSVKPRITDNVGETLVSKTVEEVAGGLCDGFDQWASEQLLHDIPDDFGWNEMSAFAAGT
jgi:FkbM family methyltransferase